MFMYKFAFLYVEIILSVAVELSGKKIDSTPLVPTPDTSCGGIGLMGVMW